MSKKQILQWGIYVALMAVGMVSFLAATNGENLTAMAAGVAGIMATVALAKIAKDEGLIPDDIVNMEE
jgi:hypothetical protein